MEGDRILELAPEFSKVHNLHKVARHIKHILRRTDIISFWTSVHCYFNNQGTENVAIFCKVSGKHTHLESPEYKGQDISIIIKPDHDKKCRSISFVVQIGRCLEQKHETRDKAKWPPKKVVRKEEHLIEKDLYEFFRNLKEQDERLSLKKAA